MSMDYDIFDWECLWRRPPQWCCQFGAFLGVVGYPYWWVSFSRGHNLWNWYRWNLFWPQPLIPWNFPSSCKWCWWLHYLVGRLNYHSNSGVHRLRYRNGWKRGTRNIMDFQYHVTCLLAEDGNGVGGCII